VNTTDAMLRRAVEDERIAIDGLKAASDAAQRAENEERIALLFGYNYATGEHSPNALRAIESRSKAFHNLATARRQCEVTALEVFRIQRELRDQRSRTDGQPATSEYRVRWIDEAGEDDGA